MVDETETGVWIWVSASGVFFCLSVLFCILHEGAKLKVARLERHLKGWRSEAWEHRADRNQWRKKAIAAEKKLKTIKGVAVESEGLDTACTPFAAGKESNK